MPEQPFVHLHLHSEYSLLDGACRLDDLAAEAASDGMEAMAITDHGNLFGAVKFFRAAAKRGIRPIIGCEAYLAPGSRFDQDPMGNGNRPYSHLILLCENETGYRNLCRLTSAAFLEGFHYKPRMDKELLRKHHEGLIALSACLGGEIPQKIRAGDDEGALRSALEFKEIFGENHFFLEVQDHGIEDQKKVIDHMRDLHRETGIPLVATNDVHFLRRDDFEAHNILMCIQTKTTLEERNRSNKLAYTREHYLKNRKEMWDLFGDIPEALLNTAAIAKRCHFAFDTDAKHYPVFKVPEGETLNSYLEKVVREGFKRRVEQGLFREAGKGREDEYTARLDRELKIITQMDLAGYFLIVWDFIRHARENGVPVGPGRGSAAGSFVSYCMGITNIDPLNYGLLFERFLNPERVSMPDIDIDFCMRGRSKIIDYVTEEYGRNNVAQIITFGEMKARLAIRDVGRALGVPLAKVDKIAKAVPADPGMNITIEGALKLSPQLKKTYDSDAEAREVLDIAKRLEGMARHASTHAAGVVIAPSSIQEFLPLYKGAGREEITTQYSKDEIEALGLLKMDFLGLRTLTIIADTLALVREAGQEPPDLESIPLTDEATFALFGDGNTDGVFQFESGGMKDILRRLKPKRFEDLIVLNALYRPGPLDAGMIGEYIARAHGTKEAAVPISEVKPILDETLGVIVYQEQVMMIAHQLAGFTLGEADSLRKAMSKKDANAMQVLKKKFLEGCRKRGVDAKKAEDLFGHMETFGRYGFNKSHSAAYALVAYQTAFLKAHYPAAFMAATLSNLADNTDQIMKYMNSCRDMDIALLPPDVNRSREGFTLEDNAIRYGLSAIKNVGQSAVLAILEARNRAGEFKDLFQFCLEVDRNQLNRRVLENLVQAGAMDCFGVPKWDLFASIDKAMAQAVRAYEDQLRGQAALFGDEEDEAPPEYEKGQPWKKLECYNREKQSLGFYLTGHPLMEKKHILMRYVTHTLKEMGHLQEPLEVTIGGMVTHVRQRKSKSKGEMYAVVSLEDMEARAEALLFSETYSNYISKVAADRAVLVVGRAVPDGDKTKLIANAVVPLDDAAEELQPQTRGVLLKVPHRLCDEDWLLELFEKLRAHSGPVPVYMDVVDEGKAVTRLQLGSECQVSAGQGLLNDLDGFLGRDRVKYLFRPAGGERMESRA